MLCIHSVVVAPSRRRQGIGTALLRAYLEHVRTVESVHEVRLIAKAKHLGFYCSCGFDDLGESSIEHGQEKWHDMVMFIKKP